MTPSTPIACNREKPSWHPLHIVFMFCNMPNSNARSELLESCHLAPCKTSNGEQVFKRAADVSRQSDIPVLVDRSGHEHTTAREKAECFALYFATKCSLGSNDFSASDQLPVMQLDASAPQIIAIHFRPTNVRRQLAALNPHKATGPDGISARVLKECHRELAEPAARLFSCCFRAGVQPASWKLAHVSPIHKKCSKSIVSNYRPVSLLSILSKAMESTEYSQLPAFELLGTPAEYSSVRFSSWHRSCRPPDCPTV